MLPNLRRPDQGSPTPIEGRCNAYLARTSPDNPENEHPPLYCKNRPVPGRNRCKFHGGMTPKGPDHYTAKRARSRYAHVFRDEAMKDRLLAQLEGKEATSLLDELGLLRALLEESVEKLDGAVVITALLDGVQRLDSWSQAHEDQLDEDAAQALSDILDEIQETATSSAEQEKIRAEILSTIRIIKDVADTENKRDYMREKSVSAKEMELFVQVILGSVARNIEDEEVRFRVLDDVRSTILSSGISSRALIGSGDDGDSI